MDQEGTWIRFRLDKSWPGKTSRWSVETKAGDILGYVKWYGSWRKYSFYPQSMTVYEEVCLREIAAFIVDRTAEYRAKKKAA